MECDHCGSADLAPTPDRQLVCADCGSIRAAYVEEHVGEMAMPGVAMPNFSSQAAAAAVLSQAAAAGEGHPEGGGHPRGGRPAEGGGGGDRRRCGGVPGWDRRRRPLPGAAPRALVTAAARVLGAMAADVAAVWGLPLPALRGVL